MRMTDLFSVDRMIPKLRARDKQEVLRKLAAKNVHDTGLPEGAIVDAVMQTADLPAFGPRRGVALPHALVPGLHSPLATVANLVPALDFEAADGSPTDLVVMLLSPIDRPGDHLRALARIARRLREPGVRTMLGAASSRDSMYVLLVGGEIGTAPAVLERSSGSAI